MSSVTSALAVAGLVGTGISAFGIFEEGRQEEKAQKFNAQVAEQQATLTREASILEVFKARKRLKALTGTQIAKFAKAGVAFTGSPLDVIQDSIADVELDIAIDKFNREVSARGFESEAEQRRRAGRLARESGQIRAATTILTGALATGQKFIGKKKIGE